jgi:hypothetical protein
MRLVDGELQKRTVHNTAPEPIMVMAVFSSGSVRYFVLPSSDQVDDRQASLLVVTVGPAQGLPVTTGRASARTRGSRKPLGKKVPMEA